MTPVYTKTGQKYYIDYNNAENDLRNIISEHLGEEIAGVWDDIRYNERVDLAGEIEERGLEIADPYVQMLRDAAEELEAIIKELIDAKRINRLELIKKLTNTRDEIVHNL